MTDMTQIRANTPSAIPKTDIDERNEMKPFRRFALVYLRPMNTDIGWNMSAPLKVITYQPKMQGAFVPECAVLDDLE
jgi:hypothetical protein